MTESYFDLAVTLVRRQDQQIRERETRSRDDDRSSMQWKSTNTSALGVAQRREQQVGTLQDAHEHRAAEEAGLEPAESQPFSVITPTGEDAQ